MALYYNEYGLSLRYLLAIFKLFPTV